MLERKRESLPSQELTRSPRRNYEENRRGETLARDTAAAIDRSARIRVGVRARGSGQGRQHRRKINVKRAIDSLVAWRSSRTGLGITSYCEVRANQREITRSYEIITPPCPERRFTVAVKLARKVEITKATHDIASSELADPFNERRNSRNCVIGRNLFHLRSRALRTRVKTSATWQRWERSMEDRVETVGLLARRGIPLNI